ncbi:peptidase M75 superfamily protein [Salegentibacter salinarum]|uniref:Peptidase M75 superfamily protein n=1 Tax=Salegentibacter salinarum TaxID=447422 RepID=A0A2N0U0C2_9FLAO|nr:imelysin family protein [Salegentibacter salinarum]PKD20444.1 peptidase M75 superfamily protein [Salegentibacter salinarum]SKB84564.1 Imelysin [Salegentibacter salinarum]
MIRILRFSTLFLLAAVISCSDTEDTDDGANTDSFDRGEMLQNWADNIIIPSFENFEGITQTLEEKTFAFTSDPSETTLNELRSAYEDGYLGFQTVSLFEIGEAEAINYRSNLNTYPLDAAGVDGKISTDDYNLELPSAYDEQGFPALDYLLNGLAETDTEIVEFYTSHENAEVYKNYLNDVSKRINALTNTVHSGWKDSFRDDFVSNTGSSSTGAVDRITNDYVLYYEKFVRSGKIGIPAGVFTGNPVPGAVEAYYSPSLSKDLYLKSLQTTQNFFNGRHFNGSQEGPGYDDYLDYLNSIKNGEDLSKLINSQFDIIRAHAEVLDNSFVSQVENNNNEMLAAYDELQQNVILLKVDMMQALSISVDYVDSDGD